ncbi:MAG: cytochrome c biogenesis CcdA family protein [Cumulibacter sp.]
MQIGFLAAFFGGVLALLSPCSALLLPAFFASTIGGRLSLLAHGAVFYLGLALTLVPLGLGLGALGTLLVTERGLIIAVASAVLVTLGLMQVFGLGFDLARFMPAASRLQHTGTGYVRTFLLGAVGGVAGFCAGPILGSILTIALAQGDMLLAGGLLAVYGAGMVVPLMAIAGLWQRLGERGRRALRGRSFALGGREFHTTSVIGGGLMIVVGVLFWMTNGFVGVPELVPTDVAMWLQERGGLLSNPVFDILAVLVVAALVIWWWLARAQRRERADVGS